MSAQDFGFNELEQLTLRIGGLEISLRGRATGPKGRGKLPQPERDPDAPSSVDGYELVDAFKATTNAVSAKKAGHFFTCPGTPADTVTAVGRRAENHTATPPHLFYYGVPKHRHRLIAENRASKHRPTH